jgi:hypothetical protein
MPRPDGDGEASKLARTAKSGGSGVRGGGRSSDTDLSDVMAHLHFLRGRDLRDHEDHTDENSAERRGLLFGNIRPRRNLDIGGDKGRGKTGEDSRDQKSDVKLHETLEERLRTTAKKHERHRRRVSRKIKEFHMQEKASDGESSESSRYLRNDKGRIVSRKAAEATKKKLEGWHSAVREAKDSLNIDGFVPIGGKTELGKRLHSEAKKIYESRKRR